MLPLNNVRLILIGGGTCSGKTTIAKAIGMRLKDLKTVIVAQDNYYRDLSNLPFQQRMKVNFDHPDSLDFDLLAEGLSQLKKGQNIKVPMYDFATHTRTNETIACGPKKIILVDGILILDSSVVRAQLDEAIFFDTPEELRFKRRLERDVHERGRTAEGVKKQFDLQVKPMHEQFVEPSKIFAQTIVKDFGDYHDAIEFFTRKLT